MSCAHLPVVPLSNKHHFTHMSHSIPVSARYPKTGSDDVMRIVALVQDVRRATAHGCTVADVQGWSRCACV